MPQSTPKDSNEGPFVSGAFICETVGDDAHGTKSYMGILDRLTIFVTEAQAPFTNEKYWVVVGLIWGDAAGTCQLQIVVHFPNGESHPFETVDLPREEGALGIWYRMNIPLPIFHPGIIWFDVLLNGRLITKFPLLVEYVDDRLTPKLQQP